MLVKGDHHGVFGGYEMTGSIKKHRNGESSWCVTAQPVGNGAMKSYWVRNDEFLNPSGSSAYLMAPETHNLKIGNAVNVSESEKKAVLSAIAKWEAEEREKPRV